jgi:uncharacterized protein YbbC (DUF1343 family)
VIATGLERLLDDIGALAGRRYGLLAHGASLTADLVPAHLALSRRGCRPAALFGPEHGYYGVEQDMVASHSERDPWTGAPILSLYGCSEASLRPSPEAFRGLDLLLIDLQDVGARYYTFAATAVWAAEAALRAGCEVWILDRPNPLGGEAIEGNLPAPGFDSFVGAFRMPVRHGLTLAEIVLLEARRGNWPAAPRPIAMQGWQRAMLWDDSGLPWVAPSPNMPTPRTAEIYPGGCLIEATEISEGRGTTRPFHLVGAPDIDPPALADALDSCRLDGVRFVPTYFKPQFQKHRGEVCGGVEIVVTDAARFASYRCGVALLAALRAVAPHAFAWRRAPYEFVTDRPAIDLLTGGTECRETLEAAGDLEAWMSTWKSDEQAFRAERAEVLLYPEKTAT